VEKFIKIFDELISLEEKEIVNKLKSSLPLTDNDLREIRGKLICLEKLKNSPENYIKTKKIEEFKENVNR